MRDNSSRSRGWLIAAILALAAVIGGLIYVILRYKDELKCLIKTSKEPIAEIEIDASEIETTEE